MRSNARVLHPVSRALTYATAAVFAALGLVLFLVPGWAADNFPWRVSNFLAMTMGGWYLGTAVFAWMAARDWRWSYVHSALAYLWLFSLGQALLVVQRDAIDGDATLTWPYVGAVSFAAGAAVVGVGAVAVERPKRERGRVAVPWWVRALAVFFFVVALLALPLLDGYDSPRSIWPGELTLTSARAFAVFFTALSLSSLFVLFARGLEFVTLFLKAGIVLSALILAAAFVYLGQFNVGDHPLQLLYIGLYAYVMVASGLLLVYEARRARAVH